MRETWLLLASIVTTIAGYYAITAAMRIGEISAVTPFRYSRLLFGLALGVLFFGERPDRWIYIGGALVVATGVYSAWREARRRRDPS